MMIGSILLMAALAALPARATSASPAHGGDAVRLGQVADLSALPADLRGRAERLPVARFAPGQDVVVTTPRRIAAVARRQIPVLAAFLTGDSDTPVVVRRPAASPTVASEASTLACARMRVSAAAGQGLTRSDLDTAACGQAPVGAWRYDPASATIRATRDLRAGEVVRAPPRTLLSSIRVGQPIHLSVTFGAVTVEREVQAAQSARAGGALFVRGADGLVFAAQAPEVQP
jgi:hypothetical protein